MIGNDEQLHIKGLSIDWDKIDRGSYLRDIEAISGLDHLEFHKPITFFVGENIRRVGQRITAFQRMIRIRNCAILSDLVRESISPDGDIFFVRRVSIT